MKPLIDDYVWSDIYYHTAGQYASTLVSYYKTQIILLLLLLYYYLGYFGRFSLCRASKSFIKK